MPESIQPIVSFIDKSFNRNRVLDYCLSLSVSDTELVYCILDSGKNKYIAIESYSLNDDLKQKLPTETNSANSFEGILHHLNLPYNDFQSIHIIINNQKSTLIPFSLYKPEEKENYLNFCQQVEPEEEVFADRLINMQTFNVYAFPKALVQTINELLPSARIFHFSSSMIEGLLVSYKNQNSEIKVFTNVSSNCLNILVLNGKQPLFYNSFHYSVKEDFIYFLIFVFEQLGLNPETTSLVLMGEIEKESAIFETIFQYIRNISFIPRNQAIDYSDVFDRLPSHYYYTLLNHKLCGL